MAKSTSKKPLTRAIAFMISSLRPVPRLRRRLLPEQHAPLPQTAGIAPLSIVGAGAFPLKMRHENRSSLIALSMAAPVSSSCRDNSRSSAHRCRICSSSRSITSASSHILYVTRRAAAAARLRRTFVLQLLRLEQLPLRRGLHQPPGPAPWLSSVTLSKGDL